MKNYKILWSELIKKISENEAEVRTSQFLRRIH